MTRFVFLFSALAVLLTACDGGADPRNLDCMRRSHNGQPWGYYPGYGCGPVPPAQTKFSSTDKPSARA